MELSIKRGIRAASVWENENKIYTVSMPLTAKKRYIFNADGKAVYTVGLAKRSVDNRIRYVFEEHETGNVFYAWTDRKIGGTRLGNILSFSPIEYFMEAESFFGEISIRRTGIKKFGILINGREKGRISRNKISCEEIDDKAILTLLYVFSLYLAENERLLRTENLM